MSAPIFAIRPQPGCAETVAAGRAEGLSIEACPLFEIRPLAWEAPAADRIDALLLGSANAVRHGGVALEAFRAKPVHAVGEATARAAEAAGLTVATTGQSGLQALVDTLSGPIRLLRPTGAEHVPLAPPSGVEIETRIAYQSVPLPLSAVIAARLPGALVLLHSAAAARHVAAECERLEVPRSGVSLAALGPRIAAAAGEGWRRVRWAEVPREAALLALARQMCHEPPGG